MVTLSNNRSGEVSVRIIGAGEQEENHTLQTASPSPLICHVASTTAATTIDQEILQSVSRTASTASLLTATLNVHTDSTTDHSSTEHDAVTASFIAQPTDAAVFIITQFLLTRDMIYNKLLGGLSKFFHSFCFYYSYLFASICKASFLQFGLLLLCSSQMIFYKS